MTTHNSHPIAQSAQKNQHHYRHRLFNAFECPVIPFLRNEPCDKDETVGNALPSKSKLLMCHQN